MTTSLKAHCRTFGWTDGDFTTDGRYARIETREGIDYFVPVPFYKRLFSDRRLAISEIVPSGSKIKFLKSLKYEETGIGGIRDFLRHPIATLLGWIVYALSKRSGEPIPPQTSLLEGFTECASGNKEVSEFPYDEYLTTISISYPWSTFREPDGTVWKMLNIGLTSVSEIEIDVR